MYFFFTYKPLHHFHDTVDSSRIKTHINPTDRLEVTCTRLKEALLCGRGGVQGRAVCNKPVIHACRPPPVHTPSRAPPLSSWLWGGIINPRQWDRLVLQDIDLSGTHRQSLKKGKDIPPTSAVSRRKLQAGPRRTAMPRTQIWRFIQRSKMSCLFT